MSQDSDLVFHIKQNDTQPTLRRQLLDNAGNPVDLTGSTVTFYMKAKNGTLLINAGACTIEGDPTLGWVLYDWQPGDTATDGYHRSHFRVEYSPANFETFPNDDYLQIEIQEAL